jgi:hypothetical protein
MPRYYFNLYNDEVTLDEEGTELANEAAAHARAVSEARAMAAESVLHGHLTAHHHVEVLDHARSRVCTVRFDEAVELRP